MDQWLANVYGTGSNDQAVDLEKVAQMAILEKLANEEGYDLSGLSEEEAVELANQVMAQGVEGEQEQVEEGSEEEMLAKEAQAKFEEADFLGRVMAHSYTQELEKIAKEYSPEQIAKMEKSRAASDKGIKVNKKGIMTKGPKISLLDRIKGNVQHAAGATGRGLRKADTAVESAADKVVSKLRSAGSAVAGSGTGQDIKKGLSAVGGHLARNKGKYGLGALAVGGGLAAHKAMSKEASAFEKLAEERAMEILQANGVQPEGQEQESNPDEQFEDALNARAVEMLRENGYQVE